MTDFVFEHLPFAAVMGVGILLGYILPSRFLTVERALGKARRRAGVYHWLREMLPILIVFASAIVGVLWVDPEGQGWDRLTSVAYFVCAGVASLPAVSIARGFGYKIHLPGDGQRGKKYGITTDKE